MALYGFNPDSKFVHPLPVQRDALEAMDRTDRSGVVVLPCGSGKSFLILSQALKKMNTLILCYESQGVLQIRDMILRETTWPPALLHAFTHELRGEAPAEEASIVVTTYGMFSASLERRAKETGLVSSSIFKKKWDLMLLDEVHHAPAKTYEPFIRSLLPNVARVLGFTGTLSRELDSAHIEAIRTGRKTREECVESMFRFLTPESSLPLVLFERTLSDMEQDGAVAKVTVARVETPMTPSFAAAYAMCGGITQKYIAMVHPNKLKVLHAIVHLHAARGDIGVIFCDHLFPVRIVSEMLGPSWGVLSGSTTGSDDAARHSAKANRLIIEKFNRKELAGVIVTSVAESAVNFDHEAFQWAALVDGHGGDAASAQKIGRLSRTPLLARKKGENDTALAARQRAMQKHAVFYELVTSNSEEMSAARARDAFYQRDGRVVLEVARSAILDAAEVIDVEKPLNTRRSQLKILTSALVEADAAQGEREVRQGTRGVVHEQRLLGQEAKKREQQSRSALFKKRHAEHAALLKKRTPALRKQMEATLRENRAQQQAPKILRDVVAKLEIPKEDVEALGYNLGN